MGAGGAGVFLTAGDLSLSCRDSDLSLFSFLCSSSEDISRMRLGSPGCEGPTAGLPNTLELGRVCSGALGGGALVVTMENWRCDD